MKSPSTLTIVCGTVIILAPILQNVLMLAMLTHLLALNPKGDYHLTGSLSSSYEGWCIFVGISLLTIGIVFAFRASAERDARPKSMVLPGALEASNA